MGSQANHLANQKPETDPAGVVALPRGPGAPKGRAKPPNSGRKKGTRNRVTREIAEIAQKHGKKIVDGLVAEFNKTEDAEVKVKIASLVLSYGYGQPTRRNEISGVGGGPIQQQTEITQAAQRVAEAFAGVAGEDDPGVAMGDESLRAAQALNFVVAQKEAVQRKAIGAPVPDLAGLKARRTIAVEAERATGEGLSHDDKPEAEDQPTTDLEALELGQDAHFGGFVIRCLPGSRSNLPATLVVLEGHSGKVITNMPNDLPATLQWCRAKFHELRGEAVTVRQTPTRQFTTRLAT